MSILGPKKSSFLSGNWPGENHLSTRIVECVSEYTFLISKSNKPTNKKKQKSKKAKERRKENISGKSIKKTKNFSAARVEIFLVTRISGSKGFFLAYEIEIFTKNTYKNY